MLDFSVRRIGCIFGAETKPLLTPDSEWLGAAVVAGVGSSLTQPSGISYFSPLYTFV